MGDRSLRGLRRRLVLTYEYLGWRTLLWRVLTFPLRFTPLRLPLGLGPPAEQHVFDAQRWARRHAPPLHTVVPGAPLTAPAGHDLLVLGPGLEPRPGAVAVLQHAAHVAPGAAVAAPIVLAGGTIESAGLCRDASDPNGLVRRFAGRPAGHGPAAVAGPVLAAAPDCALVTAAAVEGGAATPTDASLAAWTAGHEVLAVPAAVVERRGGAPAAPEAPPDLAARLDARPVRTAGGRLRVVYVTQETTVGGGHRDVFEHLNRLAARGHDVALYTLGAQPDWFGLDIAVTTFADWDALTAALADLDAIKIATWWKSALPVWRATRRHGLPVYFVQDIETSYYPDDEAGQSEVLASYRSEFAYATISGWNRDRLAELGVAAQIVAPGIDLRTFRPLGARRRDDMLLAVGRSHHLKNLDLTLDAWKGLDAPRPELCLFGVEPELGPRHGARYVTAPSDEEVNALLNEATVFLQTSRHEGFALPPLEAMATGAAVVCTDAHGNRDFCRDGVNCLMPDADAASVRGAIARLLADPALRRRLGEAGIRTAADYAWERRIDALEAVLERVAATGRSSA